MLSDETLLAGMADGDQGAASAFVRRYQARVFGMALTIVGTPTVAEDVSQEAFIKAWRHAATYDPRRGRVSTWLLTITRNAAVDAMRYRHDAPTDPDVLSALLAPDTTVTSTADESLALREAVAELPPEQRRPILMMAFQGLTAQEIATRNDVPLGTVKSRVRTGLRQLRTRMGAQHD